MLALLVIGATFQEPVRAWGFDGHAQIGNLALQEADAGAASRVWHLLGSNDTEALAEACNWPDRVQKTPRWKWGEPQHFVNIPRTASRYERDRDCPDDLCVTEAIKKYAGQLADSRRDGRSRWRAFAWLCHLTGDLHQSLALWPLRKYSTYQRVCLRFSQTSEHQDLGASHPAESYILGVIIPLPSDITITHPVILQTVFTIPDTEAPDGEVRVFAEKATKDRLLAAQETPCIFFPPGSQAQTRC